MAKFFGFFCVVQNCAELGFSSFFLFCRIGKLLIGLGSKCLQTWQKSNLILFFLNIFVYPPPVTHKEPSTSASITLMFVPVGKTTKTGLGLAITTTVFPTVWVWATAKEMAPAESHFNHRPPLLTQPIISSTRAKTLPLKKDLVGHHQGTNALATFAIVVPLKDTGNNAPIQTTLMLV